MSEDPDQPRARRALAVTALVAVVAVAALVTLAVVVVGSGDDDATPDGSDAAARTEPPGPLDALLADGSPTAGEPMPTANPVGASAAASTILPIETGWTTSAYGDVEILVLLRNAGEIAFANVAVDAVLVDEDGNDLATVPASYARVDPGQVVPISSFTTAPAEAIADIRVDVSARGTLPPEPALVELGEVTWDQDELGTVRVTGTIRATEPVEFVAIVAVLRDDAGGYLGSAFGFVERTDEAGTDFEAFGFPAGTVADIELYTAT